MTNICPKGHFSADQDYCSECGVAMQIVRPGASASDAGAAPVNALTSPNGSEKCPECMTSRPVGARFCEACRYDFVSRASFSSLAASAPADPVVATAAPDATQVLVSARANVDVVATPASTIASAQRL